MYCEKCGRPVAAGGVCPCTLGMPGYAFSLQGFNPAWLKWIVFGVAVLTLCFNFMDQTSFSIEAELYGITGRVGEFGVWSFSSLSRYGVLAFAIYAGMLLSGSTDPWLGKIRRLVQTVFFLLMFLAPLMLVIKLGSLFGSVNDLIEQIKDVFGGQNADELELGLSASVIAGWWLTVMFGLVGFVLSLIPEKRN